MNDMEEKFIGSLVGAVVGDCLGSEYEFVTPIPSREKMLKTYNSPCIFKYTDDTAMSRSVAFSLIEKKKLDCIDLAKKFTDEYIRKPYGYGATIGEVFHKLNNIFSSKEYASITEEEIFSPSKQQHSGQGSFGNGAAMRIAPASLFGIKSDNKEFEDLVRKISLITHAHPFGINGAILEATAVKWALKYPNNDSDLLDKLETFAKSLEVDSEQKVYQEKITLIRQLMLEYETSEEDVATKLGNDVTALNSVPAAIYSFLRTTKERFSNLSPEEKFKETILFSISLGGDTDTIASMAGAIAGAAYSINCIPKNWIKICEGVDDARKQAHKLYELQHCK
ncbi:DgyrCDS2492 [Dimorphilus gyrociliatus]|uniref:ADP-ribosylhydrolase ARH3 n=1 Tax=Dimorphilus gyrociliatus TaxID=2664684 RepID=A0A7I8VCE8_9ANNE|nr:DgyrCDS2492 [Dimorphilus gyrociliatus]